MKTLVLSAITTVFLIGCGGGGSSSSTSGNPTSSGTTTPTQTATNVTVERGPLLGATVKDAKGVEATASAIGLNVYTFATTPTYPITATGGYIDVNADGQITTVDIAFTGVLKSYSTVVTPITTYIATGTTEAERTTKLAEIKAKIAGMGGTVSDDDLLKKAPSTTTADIVVVTNAIYDSYSVLFDTNTTNDDISGITTLNDKITSYKAVVTQSGTGKSVKELATLVENELITTKGIQKLSQSDINKLSNIAIYNNLLQKYQPLQATKYSGIGISYYLLYVPTTSNFDFTLNLNFNDSYMGRQPKLYDTNLNYIKKLDGSVSIEEGVYIVKIEFTQGAPKDPNPISSVTVNF